MYVQDILSIRFKRQRSPEMAYLTSPAIRYLLRQPDTTTKKEDRDMALLGLLYDSAARVQELADLTPADFRFDGATSTVKLKGKGSKSRIVPLSEKSGKRNLLRYMEENKLLGSHMPAPTRCSQTPTTTNLSRVAILAIVKKYAAMACAGDHHRHPREYWFATL